MIDPAGLRRRFRGSALALGLCLAPCLALAQAAPASAPATAPASAPAAAPASAPAAAPAAPVPAPAASGGPSRGLAPGGWVIPGATAPGVYALVPALGAPLPPTTFVTDSVEIRHTQVEVCFKGPPGLQCLVLVHPSQAAPGDQRTRHFAVRAPAGTNPAVLAAAVAAIKKGEQASPWLSVAPGRTGQPAATRRSPVIVIGVVLLLVALWLAARAVQRRKGPPPSTGGAPPTKPAA